jgi:hypothetical protein
MTDKFTLAKQIDTERMLTVFFFLVGVSLFALTFTFEFSGAALFPRLTAGFIIIGSLLLLLQERLPDHLQRFVAQSVSIADPVDEFESKIEEESAKPDSDEQLPTTRGVPDTVATYVLLLAYIGLSFLIGIIWATPLFTLLYSWWFNQSRKIAATIFIVSLVIVFAFYFLVNAPLEDGYLLELIW